MPTGQAEITMSAVCRDRWKQKRLLVMTLQLPITTHQAPKGRQGSHKLATSEAILGTGGTTRVKGIMPRPNDSLGGVGINRFLES